MYLRTGTATGYLRMHRNFGAIPVRGTVSSGGLCQGEEVSPLGELVAKARMEGYKKKKAAFKEEEPTPFHGYYFKILTRQGKNAPGGKYNYIINGNMVGGFALVAFPSNWGKSGVMTFIVNQQGKVYQKNLGPNTMKIAQTMKSYNPDKTWTPVKD